MTRVCRFAKLILIVALAAGAAVGSVEAGKIYWTEPGVFPGRIYRADLGGANAELLLEAGQPWGIAVDVAAGWVYWVESGKIRRMRVDGSSPEDVVTGNGGVGRGIALDVAGGHMYWAEHGRISRADLDGSNRVDLIISSGLDGVALDVPQGKLYWSETGEIKRANLDGTGIETLVVNQPLFPELLTLDLANGKMYWAGAGIKRASLDGSQVETLSLDYDPPDTIGVAVDAATNSIYWTAWLEGVKVQPPDTGVVRWAGLSGGGSFVIFDGMEKPAGIAVVSVPFCGDGAVDAGEDCDDGNVVGGDGCPGTCRLAANADCDDNGVPDGQEARCSTCDTDSDGCLDELDAAPLDPGVCADIDGDGCDDCASGAFEPAQDGPDADSDGYCDAGDCAPTDVTVWSAPGPPRDLRLTPWPPFGTYLIWLPPESPGTSAARWDLLRAESASDFVDSTACVQMNEGGTSAFDGTVPAPGTVGYYLPRVENDCATNMGSSSNGTPRTGRLCP